MWPWNTQPEGGVKHHDGAGQGSLTALWPHRSLDQSLGGALSRHTDERRAASKGPGPEERLREYLRSKNLRMTPERRWVLQGVLSREGHFDTDELLNFLHRRHMPVSRATLYRTLDHLVVAGLVKKHRFGQGHALFEHIYGRQHHDHMMCDRCGSVFEFVNEEIERLQEEVCASHGFISTNHVMQIFGICKRCQARDSQESK